MPCSLFPVCNFSLMPRPLAGELFRKDSFGRIISQRDHHHPTVKGNLARSAAAPAANNADSTYS